MVQLPHLIDVNEARTKCDKNLTFHHTHFQTWEAYKARLDATEDEEH